MTALRIPFVVGVVVEKEGSAAESSLQNASVEGADCAELNLASLPVISSKWFNRSMPVYTTCRRAAFMRIYGEKFRHLPELSDEERMEKQRDAFYSGSAGLDIEADTFDPDPEEWTENREAVARQKALAREARDIGASVIFSWHPPRKLCLKEAETAIGSLMDRGADFVKIVEQVRTREEALDSLFISARLWEKGFTRFIFYGLGESAISFRLLTCSFGSAYLLARPKVGGNQIAIQPEVWRARALLDLTH